LYWDGLYLATFAVYLLALFCKESCLLMPLYLVLLDAVFIRTPLRRLAARLWPFAMAGAGYVLFRKLYSPVPMGPPTFDAGRALLRLFSMGGPILSYFRALLSPEPFKFCEEIEFARSWSDPAVGVTVAVFGLLAAGWLLALRRRGAAFFGLTLFALSFGPSLQIIPFFPQWAEHYLYIPSMGLAVLLGCLLREVLAAGSRAAVAVFFAVYLPFTAFVGWRTFERNGYYADTEKYYRALARSESPYAYYGYVNLAIIAIMKDSWDEAAVPLLTAHRMNPESESNNYNLGLYYFNKHNYEKARGYFRKAYETDMGEHQPLNLLAEGMCFSRLGRYAEAAELFERVHRVLPEASGVYKNLIRTYELWGRPKEALAWADRGLEAIDPARARVDHATVLMEAFVASYLNGLDADADRYLALLLEHHRQTPWFGDTARFLKGEISVEAYEQLTQDKYPYNAKDARLYALTVYVRAGRWKEVADFLGRYGPELRAKSEDPLMIDRLLGRAESAMAAGAAKT
ncbi:MAG TPA: tetratricopeptide repeat protein, partial [Candidatus Eisenbacteria bacterium]|nr:tetratricopeptide repeat protein [Candidatus Eisenbacteria bacterium]